MKELDITKKIKMIESLKCQLLSDVSVLFTNMVGNAVGTESNSDILADIVIISYLLTEKLGTSFDGLDIKIINKINKMLLTEDDLSEWKSQFQMLSRSFEKH